jgi:tetratricopeptide (TPR) repeat protein
MKRLITILLWPVRAGVACCAWFWHWLCGRPWVLLMHSSPALLVSLSLAGIVIFESSGGDAQLLSLYQRTASAALDKPDRVAAEICLRKLQRLDPSGAGTTYVAARWAELKGERAGTLELMRKLAPADRPGYPRAHFWLALHMLRENRQLSVEETDQLVHHLEVAIGSEQDQLQAHVLLADIQRARGDRVAAAGHLEAAVLDRPEMRLPLALLYTELGDEYRAREQRQRAIEYFRQRVDRDARDVAAVAMWASAVALGGDYSQGEEILASAMAKQSAQTKGGAERLAALRRALADLYVAWYDAQRKSQGADVTSLFALLQKALTTMPNHAAALNRLAGLVGRTDTQTPEVRKLLQEYAASKDVPASVQLVMGTSAAAEGNWAEARKYLEAARKEMPQMPALLNNLAWVLASETPPQLERALTMADAAAKSWPNHPEIRETRGVILARLGRWQDALVDLEMALTAFPDRPAIHRELATVYEHLGDRDLAERHRQLGQGVAHGDTE